MRIPKLPTTHRRTRFVPVALTLALSVGFTASALGAAKTIVIDGDASDWDDGDLLYTDEEISDGAPIESSYANVYVANDTNHLYVGLETKGTGGGDFFNTWVHQLYIDVDENPATGYNGGTWSGGYDRMVLYGNNGFEENLYQFSGSDQSVSNWVYQVFVENANSDSFIEFAVPLAELGLTIGDDARMQLVVSGSGVSVVTEAHSSEASATSYTLVEPAAPSGYYKSITIDGAFGDWTGVPLLHSSPTNSVDPTVIDYKDIWAANDDDYLYIRMTLHATNYPFQSRGNIFLDADNDADTGYAAQVGSEMLIQGGAGYQEKNGGFNEGGINGLDWSSSPGEEGLEFECRISRSATYDSDGLPVFAHDIIAFVLEADDAGWSSIEWAPAAGGVVYKFESAPPALTTNLELVNLTGSAWQANDSGADLGAGWSAPGYDDTGAGWTTGNGLLGYTPNPGAYPSIQTALAAGPTTYYFRTEFDWTNASDNVAFVVTNYLSDGAILYLNGTEVSRIRMPDGAVDYLTAATGSASPEGQAEVFGISGGSLITGANVLAVETHQEADTFADMVFGLSLTAAANYAPVVINAALPEDVSVVVGESATFTSDILGSPLFYQWMKDGAPIDGANEASLTIPVVLTEDAGNYSLVASNTLGTAVTRTATLSLSAIPVSIDDLSQPGDVHPTEGQSVTLAVYASGSPVLVYQWYKDNNPIADATNDTYTIDAVSMGDTGGYKAMVTNPAGSVTSRTAMVSVLADQVAPSIIQVGAAASQLVVTFSSAVDPATANDPANYSLSAGLAVTGAAINPGDASQVTLTTGSGMALGTVYELTVDGVADLYGNAANASVSFARSITIDGEFSDWDGIPPLFSGPMGVDGSLDVKDVWIYNDADYYYFRLTLWHDIPAGSGHFPAYANILYNTDDDTNTGFDAPAIGSEMLNQSGIGYEQRSGGFNEGGVEGLDWLSMPAAPGTNFEFRVSRSAFFASDGALVFGDDVVNVVFQGQTPQWAVENQTPASGSIAFTNMPAVVVPPLPLGALAIGVVPDGQVSVSWESDGALQAAEDGGSWTNVPAATGSPYVFPAEEEQVHFRLED